MIYAPVSRWVTGSPVALGSKGHMIIQCGETVFELQPDIIVNNRNLLPGDFSTPEQEIVPAKGEHDWETCMTMNESWGYQAADDNWKTPKTSLRNLITCARDGGNFLYNLGPRADAS